MLPSTALPPQKPQPHAAREMPQMMLQLGIEPAFLEMDHPALYADMAQVCAGCASRETCGKDLAAEKAASRFADYCGNAPTLAALQGRPELASD